MSSLQSKLQQITNKREVNKKESANGRARVGSTNSIYSQQRSFKSQLDCIQPATVRQQTTRTIAYRPLSIKPSSEPSQKEIKLSKKIKDSNYQKCLVIYTKDMEQFKQTYNSAILQTLKEHEEVLIGDVVVADSGNVPKDYLLNKTKRKDVAILSDIKNKNLILQHKNFYEVFYN
jgi:hypothetical protein